MTDYLSDKTAWVHLTYNININERLDSECTNDNNTAEHRLAYHPMWYILEDQLFFLYEPCGDCDGFQTVVDVLQADYFVYTPLTQLIYRVIYVYYCIIQPPL